MKPFQPNKSLIHFLGLGLASLATLHADSTVDFDPAGELEAQFPGAPVYTENATGGLSGSIGVNLANLAPDTLTGSQAEKIVVNGFANGAKFTVGMYFNLSAFGNSAVNSQNTQFLRLGLTNGAGDNFANMPFSTIDLTDTTTGAARFLVRDGGSAVNVSPTGLGGALTGVTFDLDLAQWYYFETTFTRPGDTTSTAIDYTMTVWTASSTGVLGTQVASASVIGNTAGHAVTTELNKEIFAGFKGSGATTGVLDNFYVSNTGNSQIPFKVVSYSRDSVTGESTIVFSSQAGKNYTLLGGADLANLAPVVPTIPITDPIPGTGDNVSVKHTPVGNPPRYFYSVRKN